MGPIDERKAIRHIIERFTGHSSFFLPLHNEQLISQSTQHHDALPLHRPKGKVTSLSWTETSETTGKRNLSSLEVTYLTWCCHSNGQLTNMDVRIFYMMIMVQNGWEGEKMTREEIGREKEHRGETWRRLARGSGEVVQWLRRLLLLQKTPFHSQHLYWVALQPPITPAPRDPAPSSSLCGSLCAHAHIHGHRHRHVSKG